MSEIAQLEIEQNIAIITLNRTESLNAINQSMIQKLRSYFNYIESRDDVYILILTGKGRSFCAGADTKMLMEKPANESSRILRDVLDFIQELGRIEIPTIAAINGYAFGGGAQLALTCDIRIGAKSSSYRFPGASYGLLISSYILPSIVGVPKAKELLFSSKILTSEEALNCNLINRVVPDGEELTEAIKVAKEICDNPPVIVRHLKKSIDNGIGKTMSEKLAIENEINDQLIESGSYQETFAEFVAKLQNTDTVSE